MIKAFTLISVFTVSLAFPVVATTQEDQLAVSFMSYVTSEIVRRPLNQNEITQLRRDGLKAVPAVVNGWSSENAFADSMQQFVESLLQVSGQVGSDNYNLPGYLARDIARRSRPYADLLTATSCVDSQGRSITCDTGAPYTAGVLTTKGFMKSAAGAYNISRAGKLTHTFLCSDYPLAPTEEPPLREQDLIAEFATTAGQISFGNGNNCYSCHSQFGHHTQFFVKFDLNGAYVSSANGQQDPASTDGFSKNRTLTSHLKDPSKAQSEASQILGKKAANLQEAAQVIVDSPRFLPCAVKNLMHHFLRLSDQDLQTVTPDLLRKIAASARTANPDPSFSHLLSAILSDPSVFESFRKSGAKP